METMYVSQSDTSAIINGPSGNAYVEVYQEKGYGTDSLYCIFYS
jgi:hypothetical protein